MAPATESSRRTRNNRGLTERISRVLLLQAGAIAIAAVIGVYVAGVVLKDLLITQALREEADFFWDKRASQPDFPLPDTLNLTGYMSGHGGGREPDPALTALPPGIHSLAEAAEFGTVHVSERGGARLYLVFDGQKVDVLATWFGLVPLAVVLLVLYLSVWLMYRASQRAVSPLGRLAREVDRLEPAALDPEVFRQITSLAGSEEVQVLAGALADFARRLDAFVERERHFTRDASHELRSPLTVIHLATDMLLAQADLAPAARATVERIKRSATDMEELVKAFLLLARESEAGLPRHEVCINDIVEEELQRACVLAQDKPIAARMLADCTLFVEAPDKALSILFGNLIRNAFAYTDAGEVRLEVRDGEVVIADSGVGMEPRQVETLFQPFRRGDPGRSNGHGVGLSIVKRISERFGWPLQIESRPRAGTRVTVRFPHARADHV